MIKKWKPYFETNTKLKNTISMLKPIESKENDSQKTVNFKIKKKSEFLFLKCHH